MKSWEKILSVLGALALLILLAFLYKLPVEYIMYIGAGVGVFYLLKQYIYPKIPRAEPMKEAFSFIARWWKNDMKTGEELSYEEGKGRLGYYKKRAVYGFLIVRPGKERELLINVGTTPKFHVMVWDDVPVQSDIGPFDIFEREYGVRPMPAPELDIEQHVDFYGRKRVVRKKVEKRIKEGEEEDVRVG